MAARLCVYEVTGWRLLAPAGWSGSGQVGADGGKSARIQAGTESVSFEAPTDYGSLTESAPFFASLRAEWSTSDLPGPTPTAMPGLHASAMGSHIERYALPATNGDFVDGIIVDGSTTKGCLPTFIRVQTTLSADDHPLSSAILSQAYDDVVRPLLLQCKQAAPAI
jgi:hypothetical protein